MESREGTTDERGREGRGAASAIIGQALAALGVLAGLAGAISALWPTAMANAVPSASLGILLGVVGYFLRARRLAVAAVILSAVALVLAIAVGQGMLPWTGPTDPITN
ncbi:hypothetical protein GBA65_00590 [Rubrobacter marinus]|uniref:Uncharacterized protein n=1 Tax=Rubrobacter marinus TaxID=2653852 RepID=A0A6G8PS01_9ACTN|nr:hypothetical protein [Rubrobacter marinus]QIN77259.1 hypothetical protein GBA65_00590 [Rubrobacter marinus]